MSLGRTLGLRGARALCTLSISNLYRDTRLQFLKDCYHSGLYIKDILRNSPDSQVRAAVPIFLVLQTGL